MTWKTIALIAALGVPFTGCANYPTPVEMDYGTSTKLATYGQILNPEASKNLEPVTGLSGRAAAGILENYFNKSGCASTGSSGARGKAGADKGTTMDFTYDITITESAGTEGTTGLGLGN
jgi:hypothetical protein